ncbi:MAG: DUF192 domain-containing protein [Hyphomonadaceae bacterium]|jgi:uncharacterized membrane protein (UPF0127 family)
MKRSLFAIAFALVLPAAAIAQPAETLTIVSGDKSHTVKVDVAETKAAAVAGLAGRTALAAGEGLLIDYRKVGENLSPTMKGVGFDLDLLFVAPEGTIVGVIQHARAGSLRPLWVGLGSSAVVELPKGQVAALGIKPGDKVRHRAFGNAG